MFSFADLELYCPGIMVFLLSFWGYLVVSLPLSAVFMFYLLVLNLFFHESSFFLDEILLLKLFESIFSD